jgi:hypothetical protein
MEFMKRFLAVKAPENRMVNADLAVVDDDSDP